jgi:hypothetical protein
MDGLLLSMHGRDRVDSDRIRFGDEVVAFRFLEHFLWITYAMDRIGDNHDELWDAQDGFFYDLLHFPNGDAMRLKVRSMVGLLPLCSSTVLEPKGIVAKKSTPA